MKRQSVSLLAVCIFLLLMEGIAFAQDIAIINGTDFNISRVYMSAADDDSWGDDLLGDDVLKPGEGLRISVSGTPEDMDLSLYDEEEQELVFKKLDFTEFDTLTLFSDGTGRFE